MNSLMKRLHNTFNQLFATSPQNPQISGTKVSGPGDKPLHLSTTPERDDKAVEKFVKHGQEHGVTELPKIPKIPTTETSHLLIIDSMPEEIFDTGRPKSKHPHRAKKVVRCKKKKKRS